MRESSQIDWVEKFSTHVSDSSMDVGTRGEVAAALIILMAYDEARVKVLSTPSVPSNPLIDDGLRSGRVITVPAFLDKFLGPAKWCNALPTHCSTAARNKKMDEAFDKCHMYFNHFIKVASFELVNQAYLLLALSRGAAIICADGQAGIDIITPYLVGTELKKESVGAIMYQIKNDRRYGTRISPPLFSSMDPYKCGIFSKGVSNPPPVIRIVGALASTQSGVKFRQPAQCRSPRNSFDKFTAYDVWCAGAKANTFPVISRTKEASFDKVLRISRIRSILHNGTAVQCTMAPLHSHRAAHFANWVEDAETILQELEEYPISDGGNSEV